MKRNWPKLASLAQKTSFFCCFHCSKMSFPVESVYIIIYDTVEGVNFQTIRIVSDRGCLCFVSPRLCDYVCITVMFH